ncbi:MAG: hypothetical protein WBO35_02230 [Candidatus Saccharimonadales bacterium]
MARDKGRLHIEAAPYEFSEKISLTTEKPTVAEDGTLYGVAEDQAATPLPQTSNTGLAGLPDRLIRRSQTPRVPKCGMGDPGRIYKG